MKFKILIVFTLLFCFYGFSQNTNSIDSLINNSIKLKAFPGAQLYIKKGNFIYNKSYGYHTYDSINKLNKADKINAIVFAHKDDVFEDPRTLSFFANFKGMRLIDYSELKPTKCNWADVNEKMTSDKGHNIPQSKCFTKYLEEKNYLISFLENIIK